MRTVILYNYSNKERNKEVEIDFVKTLEFEMQKRYTVQLFQCEIAVVFNNGRYLIKKIYNFYYQVKLE